MTMSTKASVTLQRKKLGERQGRNATATFREPRSPLLYKQDMSLFHPTCLCKAGMTCSWLYSASQLQGRKGQCPTALVPSPRPGALYTGLHFPPHQASPSLSFLATHWAITLPVPSLCLCHAFFLPSRGLWHPKVPHQGVRWLFSHHNPFPQLPREHGSGDQGRAPPLLLSL